ncbi:MAG: rRNA maturation RNase YbeY, partial [Deltaproteobacteria bacterium]|nr:rRNA maturation RNase YbeY [Deltaproteobacteria bacterium]
MACPDGELSLVLTDDPGIAELNEQYLGRTGPTNVISFPMREGEFGELNPHLLGDVVISTDTTVSEAEHGGLKTAERFDQLLIHGILHLFGYDHEEEQDAARMEVKAIELLSLIRRRATRTTPGLEDRMNPEKKLEGMGLELPEAVKPLGAYVPVVRTGAWMFVSGQLPMVKGRLDYSGQVGREVTLDQAQDAARICALNALALVKGELGELDKVRRVIRVGGFVASSPGFNQQPQVINGASDLLTAVFGDRGRHARVAVGVSELPLSAPVEIEFLF